LEDLLKKESGLSIKRRLTIAINIADGMDYLSTNGILHRDLKPANVLIDENYTAAITDYGVSRTINQQLDMTTAIGSPLFMAPELLKADTKVYGAEVDIYSYSLLLYQLVTKRIPFDEYHYGSVFQFVEAVIHNIRPTLTPDIPKPIAEILRCCWSENPKERHTFAYCSQTIAAETKHMH